MEKVWAILDDGPCAGQVYEIGVADVALQVTPLNTEGRCEAGTYTYRRIGWFDGKGHYIARFHHTGSLVI